MTSGSAEPAGQDLLPEMLQLESQPPALPWEADTAEAPEGKGQKYRPGSDESATRHDADVVDLIKSYLQDPAFQEEVERVAQLWDRAEAEMLAEHGEGNTAGMDMGD